MKVRKLVISTVALMSLFALTAPASAVDGETTVTLSSVDALTILAPTSASLVTTDTTAEGSLGLTTVADPNGADLDVDITSLGFEKLADANVTIAATNVSACTSTPTETTSTGATFNDVNTIFGCASKVALADNGDGTATAKLFTVAGSGLLTEFDYTPEIAVDVSAADPGIYTGTIRQSVY